MFTGFRLPELLVLLFLVLLIFGARRLPEIGSSMGKTIQAFRKSMREGDPNQAPQLPPAPQDVPPEA
jgi:sec-independent protein translocase protein TatA